MAQAELGGTIGISHDLAFNAFDFCISGLYAVVVLRYLTVFFWEGF